MRLRRAVQRSKFFNYDFQTLLLELEERKRLTTMGGCGGKKKRQREKQSATIDGNFNSTGDVNDQAKNRELVLRLIPDIAPHILTLSADDQAFIRDCHIKMNMYGSRTVFGWRQVEKIVAIHKGLPSVEN